MLYFRVLNEQNLQRTAFRTIFEYIYIYKIIFYQKISRVTFCCKIIINSSNDEKILDSRVRRTNLMYGGRLPDLRNVIFTNGDVDPWHALSVLEDLNAFSPAIFINGNIKIFYIILYKAKQY